MHEDSCRGSAGVNDCLIVNAPVAVITPIGVDHTDYLGDTIAQIAGEKAGIITAQGDDDLVPTDTVAVIGQQAPEAMEVLLNTLKATRTNAELLLTALR